jgi:uncharacterized cupin superfamily protein
MSGPVVNVDQLAFERDLRHGDKFEARIAPVAPTLGAVKLGYNVTAVPPGKRAFPFHNHHANEEMFFVLEGEGKLRFGDTEYPLRKGDFVAARCGGPDVAHQIINTGATEMRYIAVSTMIDTDVFQYPDSGKFGVVGGRKPGQRLSEAAFGKLAADDAGLDYWHGE